MGGPLRLGERPTSFEQFSAATNPQSIADALAATDTASVRRCCPPSTVVWLVIEMGLFLDHSIAQVGRHLQCTLKRGSDNRRELLPLPRQTVKLKIYRGTLHHPVARSR
jgi:hypothetical protein